MTQNVSNRFLEYLKLSFDDFKKVRFLNLILRGININEIRSRELTTTETHITKSVMCVIFRKDVMRYAFGCFQNLVLYGLKYDFKLY